MAAKMMMKFSRQSWYRTALSVLLIMCMVTSMMIMTVEEAHASVTLTGLACSAVVGLTIGALLAGSGVSMSEENSVPLINAFYWGCDAEQLAIIESFNTGQAIGDLFDVVSKWFITHLNTGNIFYSNDTNETLVFPKAFKYSNTQIMFGSFDTLGDMPGTIYDKDFGTSSFCGLNFSGPVGVYIDPDTIGPTVTYLNGSTESLWASHSGTFEAFIPIYQFVYFSNSMSYQVQSRFLSSSSSNSYGWDQYVSSDSEYFPSNLYWYLEYVRTGTMSDNADIGVTSPVSEYLPGSSDVAKALTSTTPLHVPQTWQQLWDATPEIVRTGTFTGTGGTTDPDNPDDDTDIVVGDATGTITGDGTGTGIFEGLGNFVLKLPLLSQIVTFIQNIIHLITSGNNIITSIQGVLQSIWQSITGIPQALSDIWTSVKELLSPVTGILTGIQSLVTSVTALASGEVPAELQDRIYQFSGQIFDLLSWDELSQSMAALENFGSGYGEPPVISINLHNLLEPAQNIGRFDNEFNNTETTVIDFKILEDERFGFMGMTLIELIRMMAAISMLWYTGWYVWGKIVPDEVVK